MIYGYVAKVREITNHAYLFIIPQLTQGC